MKKISRILLGSTSLLFLLLSLMLVTMKLTLWPVALASFVIAAMVGVGLFRHIKTTKTPVVTAPDPSDEAAAAMASLLTKQDKLVDEWKNTMETRDKLKILQISSNSQNQS